MKKWAMYGLKIAITVGLLTILIANINTEETLKELQKVNLQWFAAAVGVGIIGIAFNALRWQRLLRLDGIHVRILRVLHYNMIGIFYSIVLPGGKLTGDAFSAYRLMRDNKEKGFHKEYFLSLIADRFLGVLSIFILLSVYVIVSPDTFAVLGIHTLTISTIVLAITLGGIAMVTSSLLDKFVQLFEKIPIGSLRKLISSLLSALQMHRKGKRETIEALAFGLIGAAFAAGSVIVISFSIGGGISPFILALTFLLATALIVIPITVAGIGLREGGLVFLLTQSGIASSTATALSALVLASFMTFALWGGVNELYRVIKKP
jgi:glycosyltransferase 2 family protein